MRHNPQSITFRLGKAQSRNGIHPITTNVDQKLTVPRDTQSHQLGPPILKICHSPSLPTYAAMIKLRKRGACLRAKQNEA
jgi:hypothetical protein